MVTLNTGDPTYPATLVVYDRVVSTDPAFRKTWLLHSIEEPSVDGRTISVSRTGEAYRGGSYGGKLVVESLMPSQRDIHVIGGSGREFWIGSAGENFAAAKDSPAEPGAWRVEVSAAGQNAHEFLHVLTAMDETTVNGPEARRMEGAASVGVSVLGHSVVFARGAAAFSITVDAAGHMLVCGIAPGAWSVVRNGAAAETFEVAADAGCLYCAAEPGVYAFAPR